MGGETLLQRVDHLGIAVRDLAAATARYDQIFGLTAWEYITVPSQQVTVAVGQVGDTQLELLSPTGTVAEVERFFADYGEGLHHIAYTVDDIDQALRDLQRGGARLIDTEPRPGIHETRIAFVHPLAVGVLTELVEHPRADGASAAPAGVSWHLLLIAGHDATALETTTANLSWLVRQTATTQLADLARTLQLSQPPLRHRRCVVASSADEAAAALASPTTAPTITGLAGLTERPVVWMFPGGGAQYARMGWGLYQELAVFRAEVDHCAELVRSHLGPDRVDLREMLYGLSTDGDADDLNDLSVSLLALFATEYALAQLWLSWGVRPSALIGHSLGEYVAATLAGVLTLDDALALVALRGQLFEQLPPGAMLSVARPADQIMAMLDDQLSLAAINTPELCVVSGPLAAIDALQQRLEAELIEVRHLHINRAGHSKMLAQVAETFEAGVRQISLRPPQLPYLSNVTGDWITAAEATDPTYWVRHLCQTVRFADGVATLLEQADSLFLEVGPGRTLSSFVQQMLPPGERERVLPCLPHAHDRTADQAFVFQTLGKLWVVGAQIDWFSFVEQTSTAVSQPPLPRSSVSGKADAPALAQTDVAMAASERQPAAQTQTEQLLAGFWQELLGVEQLDATANFFDHGGHSLIASQLLARVRDVFNVGLPLRAIFEHPTIAGLARRIDSAQHLTRRLDSPELVPLDPAAPQALSFGQHRLWFLDQLQPGSAVYNISRAIKIRGRLAVEEVAPVFGKIIARHASLRTVFPGVDGQPMTVVLPTLELSIPVIDLAGLAELDRESRIEELAVRQAQQPFDLTTGPLLRVTLLRLHADEHILLLTVHHIVFDAWSISVLLREFAALYTAHRARQPAALQSLPVQYTDYAAWQRRWMQADVLDAHMSYWRQQLAGMPTVLDLPTDRPRPALQSFRGAQHRFSLDTALSAGLYALGRQEGVTLFMTLLAAFKVLLARWSGQQDLVVGTSVANRLHAETEPLIGFFVNTLPLRTTLADQPTFRELLQRVRDVTLSAYTHQDVPFEQLVDELQPERNLSHNPLVQVLLVLQSALVPEVDADDLKLSVQEYPSGFAKFDLTLYLYDLPNGLHGVIEYNSDLFDPATIERLATRYQLLLDGVLANPAQPIDTYLLLSPEERQRVLVEWNQTEVAEPIDQPLHVLIEAQVMRTPDAVAVVYEERSLTYRVLDERANQLAQYLRAHGVVRETRVGIAMERSLDLMVALLGVLKAGGAYVPLDPAYPSDRLCFMIEDARIPVLLTQARLQSSLPPLDPALTVIALDRDWPELAAHVAASPRVTVDGEHAAYVIYTSGSTGRPKGAINRHCAIVNRLRWMQRAYGLDASDRVLQKTPMSFDVSVWEFFWPLLTGAQLILARPGGQQDPAYLVQLIQQQQITTLHFVPSMLHAFLEEPDVGGCSSLRRIICSGEALSYQLQERFFMRVGAELHNLYGPTEAAVDVTAWACERDSTRRLVPIGRPIDNTQVYVLDKHGQPVPIGMVGELYLGGVQLARGYLNRPALTAEKFVPDPFSPRLGGVSGARLYRTGDLARWRDDGTIEFLGRIDHQIKLRGFRIELGEIEAALDQQPDVRESVVLVREDRPEDRRLVAYVVLDGRQAVVSSGSDGTERHVRRRTPSDLRLALRQMLPEHMVPSTIVMLDALPLLPNGKLDRSSLPAPDARAATDDQPCAAPTSPTEELLVHIWSEVLGVAHLGVGDSFFDLGGHSLLATQMLARARNVFGIELPLTSIFEHPTIARLAVVVEQAQTSQSQSRRSEIRRAGPSGLDDLPTSVDELSAEEIDVLLKTMLADE